jgi:hypothetical protein
LPRRPRTPSRELKTASLSSKLSKIITKTLQVFFSLTQRFPSMFYACIISQVLYLSPAGPGSAISWRR